MGWIGPTKAVQHYLSVVKADKGDDGRFIISGEPVAVGLGGDELVVPDGTVYFVQGQPKNLAAGLSSTSQGVGGIKVFNPGPVDWAQFSGHGMGAHAMNPDASPQARCAFARGKRRAAGNPLATGDEMVEKIKVWLKENDLASPDIEFLSVDAWNERHGRDEFLGTIDEGFMVVAEGTRFNYDLAGYGGRDSVATYHGFQDLLERNGWWFTSTSVWAYHVRPESGKLTIRESNPATVSSLEKYSQAELEEMPTLSSGHWSNLKVDEGNFRWWVSRMTRADGETHPIHVEERTPMGWRTVHKYGRLENPARHVHRENFAGYAKSAVRHMQLAKEAIAQGDMGKGWNLIRHAECDIRQAYTEANYAHRNDAELRRMSGRLVKVHREVVATMKELRARRAA